MQMESGTDAAREKIIAVMGWNSAGRARRVYAEFN
jgi:hypothetical protein